MGRRHGARLEHCVDCVDCVDHAVGIVTCTGSVAGKSIDGAHGASVPPQGQQ